MKRTLIISAFLTSTLLGAPLARAADGPLAFGVSAFGGGTFTPLFDVHGDDPENHTTLTFEDQDVDAAAVFGLQGGVAYLMPWGSLGVVVDGRFSKPVQQAATYRLTGVADGEPFEDSIDLPRIENENLLVTVSLAARFAFAKSGSRPDGAFGLVVGAGAGVERQKLAFDDEAQLRLSDSSPAFTAFLGGDAALTSQLAAFFEYRFSTAEHTYTFGTELDTNRNSMHHVVAGLRLGF
ncbi:MAG: hypothetical protein JNK60_05115 [Acidobacteria bacterium]|nr:hypothetical protein [Acidobacteriota bacterium]